MHGYLGPRVSGVWPVVDAPSSLYFSSENSYYTIQKHSLLVTFYIFLISWLNTEL